MKAAPPGQPPAWHALDALAAIEQLGSDAKGGLAPATAAARASEYGPNSLPQPAGRPVLLQLLRQFQSPLIYILFVAAALAAVLGHWADAAVVLGVVLANAVIGVFQEGRAERSMAALRKLATLQYMCCGAERNRHWRRRNSFRAMC